MTMSTMKRRLVLHLVRFQNAVDAVHEKGARAYEMDSQFDGGEFSGPAIGRWEERQEQRLARRFGFATPELAYRAANLLGATLYIPAHVTLPDTEAPLPR